MSDDYRGDLDFSGEGGDHLAILINLNSVAGLLPSYNSTEKIYSDETRDRFMQYTVDMFFRPYSYVEAIHRNLMLGLFPTHEINNPFKDMSAFAQNTLDQINMEFSMLLRALLTPVVMNKGRIYTELVCSDVGYELLLFAPVSLFDDSLIKSMKIVKWSRIEDLVLGFRHLRKARHPIRENKVSHLNGMEDVHTYVGPLGLSSVLLEETLTKVDSKKKSKKKVTA